MSAATPAAGATPRRVLVFGGATALGAQAVTRFAAGGWDVVSLDFYDSSSEDVFESVDFMVSSSLHSSVVTARLATAFLRPGGMLTFTGSVAALSPQPKLLAFAVGHAAVHQLVRSLAAAVGVDLPDGVTVVGVVPEVLDTAMHRQLNRGRADDNWTSCNVVAEKLFAWAEGGGGTRPPNGALVSVTSTMVAEGQQEHAFRLINTPSYVQTAEY
ncbi:hypothetical protein I4F81_007788 [Pyropia yezoensis]|uniref:Uncharacterized protein n=1 Tax=Pyropia yezoensis TaxID=2788 RepID=A0ACC3C5P0_PYRYE|nr:hypothetical protein I4F81_007788 [Neopyropia yezoensis]